MKEIDVTIIICSYNQEKFIQQAIESVLTQEHQYSWELIVCDDASKDNTPKIIAKYSKEHKEIRSMLRKKNLGIVKNFFDGVLNSRGKYIMICGGDDYFLPNKIKDQIDYLIAHPDIGLIHSDAHSVNEKGEFICKLEGCEHKTIESLLTNYNIWAATMTFRKKDLLRYVNEIEPMSHGWIMEDLPLSLWFKTQNKMKYLSGCYAAYRVVENSLCHQTNPQKNLLLKISSVDVVDYFFKNKIISISKDFFLNWKLRRLITPYNIKYFKSYCYEILEECRASISKKTFLTYKIKIKYPIINRILALNKLL